MPRLRKADGDLRPYIGIDKDGDGYIDTVPVENADLESKIDALNAKLDGIIDGSTPAVTELTGSLMEYYGATVADRPDINTVPTGAIYMAVNSQEVWQSNGVDWVVMA